MQSDRQIKKKKQNKEKSFSAFQIEMAAMWWAQFLPGVQKVSLAEIHQHLQQSDPDKQNIPIMDEKNRQNPVTAEQYNLFLDTLYNKITKLPAEKEFGNPYDYLSVGNPNSGMTPKIILESIKEANIQASAFDLFFSGKWMRIYNNGQIMGRARPFSYEVVSTNPEIIHYGAKTNLDSAHLMKITGGKFKMVEIKKDKLQRHLLKKRVDMDKLPFSFYFTKIASSKDEAIYEHLLKGSVNKLEPLYFSEDDAIFNGDDLSADIPQVYAKLYLSGFKGTEEEFLELTNEKWIRILQDPSKIKKYFHENACISYVREKDRALNSNFSHALIGILHQEVGCEQISKDYYQYATRPVRVLSAPKEGTIGWTYPHADGLKPIHPNDFIVRGLYGWSFLRKCDVEFNYGPEGRLCDEQGKILSDKVYRPGDELPKITPISICSTAAISKTIPAIKSAPKQDKKPEHVSMRDAKPAKSSSLPLAQVNVLHKAVPRM